MSYEIHFLGSDQLGDGGSRLLILKGRAQAPFNFALTWGDEQAGIKQRFINDGWSLQLFDLVASAWSDDIDITIHANVLNNFSAEQVRLRAVQLLSNDLRDVGLNVSTNDNLQPAPKPSDNGGDNGGDGSKDKNPFGDLFKNLFGATGTSVLAVAVVLGVIVILKD